jgi:hypothetical protein
MIISESILTTFESSDIFFEAAGAVAKNWLKPKPPQANKACHKHSVVEK